MPWIHIWQRLVTKPRASTVITCCSSVVHVVGRTSDVTTNVAGELLGDGLPGLVGPPLLEPILYDLDVLHPLALSMAPPTRWWVRLLSCALLFLRLSRPHPVRRLELARSGRVARGWAACAPAARWSG